MIARIRTVLRREEGASAVEYGLLVAGIAMAIVVAVFLVGNGLSAQFDEVSDNLPAPVAPAGN